MPIEERVRRVITNKQQQNNVGLQQLRDFYETKKNEGVVTKQEYNLPPIDTIGRTLYTNAKADKDNKK